MLSIRTAKVVPYSALMSDKSNQRGILINDPCSFRKKLCCGARSFDSLQQRRQMSSAECRIKDWFFIQVKPWNLDRWEETCWHHPALSFDHTFGCKLTAENEIFNEEKSVVRSGWVKAIDDWLIDWFNVDRFILDMKGFICLPINGPKDKEV